MPCASPAPEQSASCPPAAPTSPSGTWPLGGYHSAQHFWDKPKGWMRNTILSVSSPILWKLPIHHNKSQNLTRYIIRKWMTKHSSSTHSHSCSLGVLLKKKASVFKSSSWKPMPYTSGGSSSTESHCANPTTGDRPFTFQVPTNTLEGNVHCITTTINNSY